MLVLIFGPTGAGKSEIIRRLVERKGLVYVTPQMTRPLRLGEMDKELISESSFSNREAAGEYILVNKLFGFRYGTPRHLVEEAVSTATPSHVLDFPLEAIEKLVAFDGYKVGILIMPPSKEVLADRLRGAGREDRVAHCFEQYDRYQNIISSKVPDLIDNRIIVNCDIEVAYAEVEKLLRSLELELP